MKIIFFRKYSPARGVYFFFIKRIEIWDDFDELIYINKIKNSAIFMIFMRTRLKLKDKKKRMKFYRVFLC